MVVDRAGYSEKETDAIASIAEVGDIFDHMLEGCALHEIICDAHGIPCNYRFLRVNAAFEQMTGLTARAIIGKTVKDVLPETEPEWIEIYGRVALTGEPARFESTHGGLGRTFQVVAFRPATGQFACTFRDITEAKAHEREIERISRLYAVLSEMNHAIVRSQTQNKLFDEVCRIATQVGRFQLSWIGMRGSASDDLSVACQECDGFDSSGTVSATRCAAARSVMETERSFVCNHLTDQPWWPACKRTPRHSNVGSCAAFPIRSQTFQGGVLCLHAIEADFFNADEVRLLDEVALDISFALNKLEERTRRERAEEALRQSELLYRTLFETASDAIFLHRTSAQEPMGSLIAVNAAGCARLGYSRDELLRMSLIDINESLGVSYPAPSDDNSAPHDRVVFETVHVPKNGAGIRVEINSVFFELGGEKVALAIARDITERKKAESVLRESEARLREAQRLAHIGDSIWDPGPGTVVWSEELYRITGWDPDAPPPSVAEASAVYSPASWTQLQAAEKKILDTGDPYDLELEIVRPDGQMRWVHARGDMVVGTDGYPRLHSSLQDITERKRVEDLAKATQANLSVLIESTADVIWYVDLDDKLVVFNNAFEELVTRQFGTKAEIGKRPKDLLPPEVARYVESLHRHAENEGRYRAEYQFANGHILDISLSTIVSNGAVIGISAFAKDMTERNALLETIQKTAAEYQTLFDEALEGIFRMNPDGRILAANPALARILGYDSVDLLMASITDAAHQLWADPEERPRYRTLLDNAGSLPGYECQFLRSDGTAIWVSLKSHRVCDLTGQTLYYEGLLEDISERRQSEKRLRISQERLEKALITGADAFTIATDDGFILDVNKRFTEIFGYSREESIGKTTVELGMYPDHDRARLISERNAQGFVRDLEFRALRKDGTSCSVLISSNSLVEDGKHLHLQVIRDITAQRRAEEEKGSLEEQFRQAQKLESVGRLAGGVAHDFNNLLTVINGYGDLLLQRVPEGDRMRDMVIEIRNAGERAAALTRQLLTFSRKQVVEMKPVDIGRLVADNHEMFRRLVGEDVEFTTKLAPGTGEVMADVGQIHQVLMNLIVNARDAMPDGGRLTIEAQNVEVDELHASTHPNVFPGQFVMLTVSDTGTGIPEEIRPRIFDPFFTTKGEGIGTGLGLSTTYGIVRQFGGSLSVSSESGKGSTFEILLPRLITKKVQQKPSGGLAANLKGSETILVVEDQNSVRKLACQTLRTQGYNVLEASDGIEALRVAQQYNGPIHLLLTDLVMPKMTGKELAAFFLPLRPDAKLIYMSGYTADASDRALLDTGAMYLPKPFSPSALAAKVREALGPVRAAVTVLVVDDEKDVRDYLEETLSTAGYRVVVAGNGKEAVEIARSIPVDLVVTDLVMPEQEGIETIQILRQRHPKLKIIAISGAFAGEFLGMAAMLGASATLMKPFGSEQLIPLVHKVLSVS